MPVHALAANLRARGVRQSLGFHEQFGPYAPGQDATLSKIFGVGVKSFQRGPGHMNWGYADPFDRNRLAVNIAAPLYAQLYTLTQPGMNKTVTPREAKAAYVFSHEMGHLFSPNHTNETMANSWAASHMKHYLKKMGVAKPQRQQIFRLAKQQFYL